MLNNVKKDILLMAKVYLLQDIPVDRETFKPKFNVMGAQKYGDITVVLPAGAQIIFSPAPLIMELRNKLRDYTKEDYLILTGDPSIIGVACSIVSDITNGKYKLLKWDKQERRYYPVEIDLYNKG